jgi:hypothetical protein
MKMFDLGSTPGNRKSFSAAHVVGQTGKRQQNDH